jgi:DMSO/TMAO reductase YedYZ molybdopterin-dependent catalytic subunit
VLLPRLDPDRPPVGPFRAEFWRSPLRGRWLTSVLGLVLLIGLPVVAITGLLSNDAYQPHLGNNVVGVGVGRLNFDPFAWPTHPAWLYAFTQGLHVSIGLALLPVLLAKLWSVAPRLFEWPALRSPAHALERLSLVLLVGSAMFEFATGIIDIQLWAPFGFYFPAAHYYGALVFIAAFTLHAVLKLPTMRKGLALRRELAMTVAGRESSSPATPAGRERSSAATPAGAERPLAAPSPGQPTFSRRALLGTVGAGSLLLLLQGAGESIGGVFRPLSFLGPRERMGSGPNGFPVNRTAVQARLRPSDVDDSWRLRLAGVRTVDVSRAQLLAMPQHTYDLPIACVEGWSTTQRWSGVRLRDLAMLAGVGGPTTVQSVSLARDGGLFDQATLGHEQVADERSLLALRVNGAELSLDHGYPARVIGPALPGVHCTKWVVRMEFTPV